MSKRREFPIYGATQALNARGEMRPQAKRLTLSEVTRRMAALKANLARIDMRLSKAEAHGNAAKVATLVGLQASRRNQFLSLVNEFIRLGGGTVKEG